MSRETGRTSRETEQISGCIGRNQQKCAPYKVLAVQYNGVFVQCIVISVQFHFVFVQFRFVLVQVHSVLIQYLETFVQCHHLRFVIHVGGGFMKLLDSVNTCLPHPGRAGHFKITALINWTQVGTPCPDTADTLISVIGPLTNY